MARRGGRADRLWALFRFIKRPYAKHDDSQLKSRANRVAWEHERDKRTEAWGAASANRRDAIGKDGKWKKEKKEKKGAAGEAGGGAAPAGGVVAQKKKRKRREEKSEKSRDDSQGGGRGEGDEAAAKRARTEEKAAKEEGKEGKRRAEGAAEAEAGRSNGLSKTDQKLRAKAKKKGMTEERLDAFAALAKKNKKKRKEGAL